MLENDADPTEPQRGWSRCLEVQHFRRDVWPTLTDPNQALLRLQAPSVSSFDRFAYQPGDPNRPTTFLSVVVQTPLSPTSVDLAHLPMWPPCVCGYHRVERAAAQVCREAGGRVGVDRFVRDLDLGAFNHLHARRIKVIVDGLCLWHGAQLAVDTTVVSPLHGDGSARRNTATSNGVSLQAARRAKETTYPELSGEGRRARLVVLAAEVGGRWSQETADFLNAMAKAKAEEHPRILQGRVRDACVRQWSALLACCLARSLAVSLLERRPVPGTGGDIPSVHEVVRDARFG